MTLPTMPGPIRIDPAAVYTVAAAVLALDVPSATIRRAIQRAELPAVRRGGRAYIMGRDLLAWLSPPASTAAAREGASRG